MLKNKAIVYGWYGKTIKNIGDLLFCKAFKNLFPTLNFTFTGKLQKTDIETADIIIFGGGSFLYAPINSDCADKLVELLAKKKVFYIGVGTETDIHPIHQTIMKQACLIATRTPNYTSRLEFTKADKLEINDIVYSLIGSTKVSSSHKENSVLIIPNAELLPKWSDINWKHVAWGYFKSEFSQFLDILKETKHKITFAPMCMNSNMHDLGAAIEIINQMKSRNFTEQIDFEYLTYDINNFDNKFEELTDIISQYDIVISQRYHGSILAHMCQRPCLVLAHHDKLKNSTNSSITLPFYELSKAKLLNAFEEVKKINTLPIKLDTFDLLKTTVYSKLEMQCQNLSVSKTV